MSKKSKGTPLFSLKMRFYINRAAVFMRLKWMYVWQSLILSPIRQIIAKTAFKIAVKSRRWNQRYYDEVVKGMYVAVREKEAFTLKERIIDAGKGSQHVKMLMIQTPKGEMEITLSRQEYPDLYNINNKSKRKKP